MMSATSLLPAAFHVPAPPGRIRLGLIGEGIGPSRTPRLHMQEGAAQGLDIQYDLFDLPSLGLDAGDLPELLAEIEAAGYAGVNVTHPCKQAVIPLLTDLSPDARALGAVNTVLFKDGARIGHNTDWSGFFESFRQRLPDVDLTHAVQIGAGGAGAAVSYALLKLGVRNLTLIDTDLARPAQLVERYAGHFPAARLRAGTDCAGPLATATGLVNCTPMGMAAHPGLPLPVELLRPDLWVAEIVYFPLDTALVQEARALGCRVSDGGGMAVYQAVDAFRLFTGQEPDAARMARSFNNA